MARPRRENVYKPEYAEQGRKLCLLGATQADLAEFFNVTPAIIAGWEKRHVEFRTQLELGRAQADAEIADKLFQRARGYKNKTQKAFQYQGLPVVVEFEETLPPDVTAGIFWLKNRRKDTWRDRHDHQVDAGEGLISLLSGMNKPEKAVLRPARGAKKDTNKDG